jgi:hypothetical protein
LCSANLVSLILKVVTVFKTEIYSPKFEKAESNPCSISSLQPEFLAWIESELAPS